MQLFKIIFYTLLMLCLTTGCQIVKPYQRAYLNDAEMQMGNDIAVKFENKILDIREGAYPAGSGASAGGCGCN